MPSPLYYFKKAFETPKPASQITVVQKSGIRAATAVSPYAVDLYASDDFSGSYNRHRASRNLRYFADTSEWTRVAINRRKRQISQAPWRIVRIDDPSARPNPKVVKEISELLRYVNSKGESLRSFFDAVMEDLLILDAGCLHGAEIIPLADGRQLPISQIVNGKLDVEVLAFNPETGMVEPRRVNGWHRNQLGNRHWVRVSLDHERNMGRNGNRSCWMTNDHPVLTENGEWLEVALVPGGVKIATKHRKPDALGRELFDGTMLGDAHLGGRPGTERRCLEIAHCKEQLEWLSIKSKALGLTEPKKTRKLWRSRSQYTPWMNEQSERWRSDSRKIVPSDIVITPALLAAWYMDDGSHIATKYKQTVSHAGFLHCHSFSDEEKAGLIEKLCDFGIECGIQKDRKYTRIYITVNGFKRLNSEIGRFVPPSMRYKLTDDSPAYDPSSWDCGTEPYYDTVTVVSGHPMGENQVYPKTSFCIDVEGLHNFIPRAGMVVHNCIEKEYNLAGKLVGLHAVDGSTIEPDPKWDGSRPDAVRYRQFIDDVKVAEFKNNELIYMMANPRTTSAIGMSPVEWLVRIIEAEIFGENFDHKMLKETTPAGIIDLGSGVMPEDVEAFREYYNSEIAGKHAVAIFGGGDSDTKAGISFESFARTANDLGRESYRKWLATKVAAVFEMDLGVFNLTEQIHRSIGEKQQSLTDDGHRAYGTLVEEFFTREIVWEFDKNHAFRFADLNERDAVAQAELDKMYISLGALTVNEVRHRNGFDPVEWGNTPYLVGTGYGPYVGPLTPEEFQKQQEAAAQAELDLQAAKAITPGREAATSGGKVKQSLNTDEPVNVPE